MNEIFPILSGFLVGSVLTLIRPNARLTLALVASIVLGTTATIVSGEYKVGWEFLVIDIPLVALSAIAGFTTVRIVRSATADEEWPKALSPCTGLLRRAADMAEKPAPKPAKGRVKEGDPVDWPENLPDLVGFPVRAGERKPTPEELASAKSLERNG
jgi:hypothetical protein